MDETQLGEITLLCNRIKLNNSILHFLKKKKFIKKSFNMSYDIRPTTSISAWS